MKATQKSDSIGAWTIAPMPDDLGSRVDRLCTLIQHCDARLVYVHSEFYRSWQHDKIVIIATMWSETCQNRLDAQVLLPEGLILEDDFETQAPIYAALLLNTLEQAEAESEPT